MYPIPFLWIAWAACAPIAEGTFDDECFDGLDNDGNGPTDCEDAACEEICANQDCRTHAEVCINEFVAENNMGMVDETGDTSDWIELHNPSSDGRSLTGFTITDDLESTDRHPLDGLSIPAGGYLILWASGEVSRGDTHLPFRLAADGDALGLYCPLGSPTQEIAWTEAQGSDVSTGRLPDCGGAMTPGLTPTPWTTNTE